GYDHRNLPRNKYRNHDQRREHKVANRQGIVEPSRPSFVAQYRPACKVKDRTKNRLDDFQKPSHRRLPTLSSETRISFGGFFLLLDGQAEVVELSRIDFAWRFCH